MGVISASPDRLFAALTDPDALAGPAYVMGSGELVQALIRHDLVDEYLLLIHPLVLGAGRRLFGDGGPPASLDLVDSTVSATGVVIATYQPEQLD